MCTANLSYARRFSFYLAQRGARYGLYASAGSPVWCTERKMVYSKSSLLEPPARAFACRPTHPKLQESSRLSAASYKYSEGNPGEYPVALTANTRENTSRCGL